MGSIKHLHRSNTMIIIAYCLSTIRNYDLVYEAHNRKIIQ